jgi:DNA invertase Pin-like site-specific DNA recombinase
LIGYARVSTDDQRLDVQREALRRAGCENVFEDTASGRVTDRPGLLRALDQLRDGDTLVVWKLDRLGRSVKQLVDLVSGFERDGVNFVSITDAIDTSTPAGRFFFHVMASLAEMERELTVERTRAGLQTARLQGRVGGRRRLMTESKVSAAQELLRSGRAARDVAAALGVSLATLYRWVPAEDRLNAPQPGQSVPLPSNDADNLV